VLPPGSYTDEEIENLDPIPFSPYDDQEIETHINRYRDNFVVGRYREEGSVWFKYKWALKPLLIKTGKMGKSHSWVVNETAVGAWVDFHESWIAALDPDRESDIKLSGAFVNYEQFMLDPFYSLVEINETLSRLGVGTHSETPYHYRKYHHSKNGEAIDESRVKQEWTLLDKFWLPNMGEHSTTSYETALKRLKVYQAGVEKGLFVSSNVTMLAEETKERLFSYFLNV